MNEAEFQDLLRDSYKKKEFLPTGVAILSKGKNPLEYLVVQSAKCSNIWAFPQGGINLGESIEENLKRELNEELGIANSEISFNQKVFYHKTLYFEMPHWEKQGFTKGKTYFFSLLNYLGKGNFKLDKNEVLSAIWCKPKDALEMFYLSDAKKADLLKEVLEKLNLLPSSFSCSNRWS